jgi:glycosyltransferase involved in cell wall biosynthesis
MSISPKVSIVTAFLNAEAFLPEAVASVLEQTEQDWELLLCDDGSTDGSSEMARQYAEQFAGRIRYFDHPEHAHRGTCAARNLALQNAQGNYIAFLDSDDVWLPHKLERQLAVLHAHPKCNAVFGTPLNWFGWTGKDPDRRRDSLVDLRLPVERIYDPPLLVSPFVRRLAPVPCPSDMLLRSRVLDKAGSFDERFSGKYQLYEDQAFIIRICLHCSIYVSAESWIKYRRHPNSYSTLAKKEGLKHEARRFFLDYLETYLVTHNQKDGLAWRAVEAELAPFRHPTMYFLASGTGRALAATKQLTRGVARRMLPASIQSALQDRQNGVRRALPRRMRSDPLWRLTPVSQKWGFDRGQPVDRYYIDRFLADNGFFIRGRVLEIGDASYTQRFGGSAVTLSETLHYDSPAATYRADLTEGIGLSSDTFDCIICTQTLHIIYDMRAAIRTLVRLLKPSGVLLATFAGISRISPEDSARWGDFWRVTACCVRRLFAEVVPERCIDVQAYGNVLSAVAFLHGLAAQELQLEELDDRDPLYEVLIGARVIKPKDVEPARSFPHPAAEPVQ